MSNLILPGILGLLLGLTLRWTRLCHPGALRTALALRISHILRSLLYLLGAGVALTALLMWLAVIDVDEIAVLPLSAGTLVGGAIFGVAMALAGYTPLTAFAGVGGGQTLQALCTLAGCLTGALLLPLLEQPLSALQALPPHSVTTLFRTTLDEAYLLGGGFLGQGCTGLLLMVIAACIPSNRKAAAQAAAIPTEPAEALPVHPEHTPDVPPPLLPEPALLLLPAPEPAPQPEADATVPPEAAGETFVALLPGEEPLVVDTALDEDAAPAESTQENTPAANEPTDGDAEDDAASKAHPDEV